MADLRVFFVTNRNYQPQNKQLIFGPRFNPDGVAGLRFGYADFDDDGDTPKLSSTTVYPDVRKDVGINKTGGGKFLDDLRLRMKGDEQDALVFIHGFNVSFTDALAAGSLLARDVRRKGKLLDVIVLSWPSDGEAVPFMSYYSDREDARASGPSVARAFLKLLEYMATLTAEERCRRRLHLLTHSMGAYVLRHAVGALRAKDPKSLVRIFDQIMLAAPDEDDDTFESDEKLRLLPRLGNQVTVYFNPRDKALTISDVTKGNPDRLGSEGPRMVDLIPKKVVLVDCRNVAGHAQPLIEHSYYIRSRAMADDIGAVLAGAEPDEIGNRQYVAPTRAWRIVKEPGITKPDTSVEATFTQPPAPAGGRSRP